MPITMPVGRPASRSRRRCSTIQSQISDNLHQHERRDAHPRGHRRRQQHLRDEAQGIDGNSRERRNGRARGARPANASAAAETAMPSSSHAAAVISTRQVSVLIPVFSTSSVNSSKSSGPRSSTIEIVDRMLLDAAVLGRPRASGSIPSPGCGTVAAASGAG